MWFETRSGRCYSFRLQTLAKTAGESLRAVLHSSPWPKDLGYRQHRRRGPGRSRTKNDRQKRLPACLLDLRSLRSERNRARACRMRIVPCPLVMRRWTDPAQISAGRPDEREGFSMGFRRRVRRRALVAGAVGGAAIAHHARKKADDQAYDEAPADDQAPADDGQDQAQYAPPPADPADEIEHLAQLHTSGALTDDEFAAAKAKILGT
jgi:Short C-terminal domain